MQNGALLKCHLNTGQPDHLNTGQMDAIFFIMHWFGIQMVGLVTYYILRLRLQAPHSNTRQSPPSSKTPIQGIER